MITMCAPVVFDPNARDRIWEDFLDRVLPNSELQGFVQRAAGYSSTGDCGEEVLFFPYGPTQTGKSTLLGAVAKTFGDYAMTADFGAFLARDRNAGGPRNDIAAMSGKRMVISVEVDPGQRMAGALVKTVDRRRRREGQVFIPRILSGRRYFQDLAGRQRSAACP